MVPFHHWESNLTNICLDLECFLFSLLKYITLNTKQARVLQENGVISPVGIHSDQFKFGIRMVSLFLCQIYCGKKNVMIFFRSLWYLSGRSLAVVFCALAHTALQYYSRWWLATKVTKAMDRSCSPQDEILKFWFLI